MSWSREATSATSAGRSATAELAGLRAENVQLKKRLQGSAAQPWGAALLAEVAKEPSDERRIFFLKGELRLAASRRAQLQAAVRARHAGLERILWGRAWEKGPAAVEATLADGAADTRGEEDRGPLSTLPSMEAALEVEQHLSQLGKELASLPQMPLVSALRHRVEIAAEKCALAILECAADLPPAEPFRAAAARRQLGRLLQRPRQRAAAAPEAPAESVTEVLPPGQPSGSAVQLPDGLLLAWRNLLDDAEGESATTQQVLQEAVAKMAEEVAASALRLQALHGQLALIAEGRSVRP
mmetsp:Transcript_29578/g.64285  ORF Transcript_29578/g.64285 Transcript_29578/m.64285 type:complete len:298 (+) Transcript_29578:104-997(+)